MLADVLKVGDVSGTAVLLVALAATIGQIFLALLSLLALRSVSRGLAKMLTRSLLDGTLAAIAGGVVTYAVLTLEGGIAPLTTLMSVFLQGFVAGIVGLAAAALALSIVENEEFRIVTNALGKLLQKGSPAALAPSAEEPIQP